jgi:hypothetical protein
MKLDSNGVWRFLMWQNDDSTGGSDIFAKHKKLSSCP